MHGGLETLLAALLPLAGLLLIFRVMFRGTGTRPRSKASASSPTRLLRGRGGPFQFNSRRSPLSLWTSYALAMVLSTQVIFDSASLVAGVDTTASGHATDRVVVGGLVLIGCVLAVIMSLPGGIPGGSRSDVGFRQQLLDLVDLALGIGLIFATHFWAGSVLQVAVAIVVLRIGGAAGVILQCGAVLLSYYLTNVHDGHAMVVLSIVMTMLMGALTMMLVVMARTMGRAISIGIVAVVAILLVLIH